MCSLICLLLFAFFSSERESWSEVWGGNEDDCAAAAAAFVYVSTFSPCFCWRLFAVVDDDDRQCLCLLCDSRLSCVMEREKDRYTHCVCVCVFAGRGSRPQKQALQAAAQQVRRERKAESGGGKQTSAGGGRAAQISVCVTLQSLQREIHCGSAVVVVVTADQLVSIISFSEYTWVSLTRSDLARMQIWGDHCSQR